MGYNDFRQIRITVRKTGSPFELPDTLLQGGTLTPAHRLPCTKRCSDLSLHFLDIRNMVVPFGRFLKGATRLQCFCFSPML